MLVFDVDCGPARTELCSGVSADLWLHFHILWSSGVLVRRPLLRAAITTRTGHAHLSIELVVI